LLDLFPTVCDLVGANIPGGLDGKSLKPVIEGKSAGVRDSLFLSYRDVQRAVRDSRWKLIRYPQVNITQLFDLQTDPDEITNLADRAEHRERLAALTAEMARWQTELGDAAPLTFQNPQSPHWDPSQPPPMATKKAKKKK